MTVTGSENYVIEYSYSDAQGKYTALLQKETKTVENKEDNDLLNPYGNFKIEQTVYSYDKNGNQLTKTAEGKTETNTYDGLNQLIGFTDGETTASYVYNVDGLRYEKTVDGQTINHVWDGNKQIIADVIDNQFYEADCYIRGTNLVAKYNYKNGDKSEYIYYTQNAHGDVVNLTNANGEVTKTYKYDAFGVEKDISDSDTNAFRYCGEYYDAESGTIYLRARYYDPTIGRFISRDSDPGKNDDPLSLNLYTYCYNNPILGVDPDGNAPKWLKKAVGAVKDFASSTVGKVVIGTVATVAAVGITVATGGAAAPVLATVASSTVMGAGVSAVKHRVQTGSWKGAGTAALRGAADGYMWGGIGAFAGAGIKASTKALQLSGKLPIKVKTNNLRNNPLDEFTTLGPKPGKIGEYMQSIKRTGDYGKIFVTSTSKLSMKSNLSKTVFQIADGHHRANAAIKLGYKSLKTYLTK